MSQQNNQLDTVKQTLISEWAKADYLSSDRSGAQKELSQERAQQRYNSVVVNSDSDVELGVAKVLLIVAWADAEYLSSDRSNSSKARSQKVAAERYAAEFA